MGNIHIHGFLGVHYTEIFGFCYSEVLLGLYSQMASSILEPYVLYSGPIANAYTGKPISPADSGKIVHFVVKA